MAGGILAATDEAVAALGEPRLLAARDGGGKYATTAARYLRNAKTITQRLLVGRIMALLGTAVLSYDLALHLDDVWARRGVVAIAALLYSTTISTAATVAPRRAGRVALPMLRYVRPLELLIAPFAAPL